MKSIGGTIVAAIAMACFGAGSAGAVPGESGHWVWITEPIIGPKSTPANHRRIWVPDQPRPATGPGHWQWITEVSVGPHSGAPLHRRVWVPDR